MLDGCGRTIDYLRLSVTDLCNYRCRYCMPPEGVAKRDHGDILSLEELETSQGLSSQVLPGSDLPTWVSPTYLATSSSYECTESSSLYRFYARTRWAFLAEPYVRAWLEREQAEEAQPQTAAGFDQAWACRLPGGTQLFAGVWDDEVVILQYVGQADLLEAVENYDWTFPLPLT